MDRGSHDNPPCEQSTLELIIRLPMRNARLDDIGQVIAGLGMLHHIRYLPYPLTPTW